MNSTTTQFGPDFVVDLIPWMLQTFDEATKKTYHMFWDGLLSFVMEHWLAIVAVLIIVFLFALIQALAGYWGMLGSVLYHYLYFGILFAMGLINGPEVFVSEYFEIACALILYPICYFVTGIILHKIGIRKF